MRIAYLIKVRPDLRDIVPEDVEDYVQIFVDDNGLYSESDLNKLNNMDFSTNLGVGSAQQTASALVCE